MHVLLEHLERFLPLNDFIIEDFNTKFNKKHFQKRDKVFTAPDVCESFYFVAKGLLRVYTQVNGKDITTEFIEEGQFSTIMESFHTGEPSKTSIVAEQNSEVLVISKKDFYTLLKKYQGFSDFALNANEVMWVKTKERILKLLSMDSESIYLDFVQTNPELYKKIKGKDLSTYLNMTQETASRIKKKNNISKK